MEKSSVYALIFSAIFSFIISHHRHNNNALKDFRPQNMKENSEIVNVSLFKSTNE